MLRNNSRASSSSLSPEPFSRGVPDVRPPASAGIRDGQDAGRGSGSGEIVCARRRSVEGTGRAATLRPRPSYRARAICRTLLSSIKIREVIPEMRRPEPGGDSGRDGDTSPAWVAPAVVILNLAQRPAIEHVNLVSGTFSRDESLQLHLAHRHAVANETRLGVEREQSQSDETGSLQGLHWLTLLRNCLDRRSGAGQTRHEHRRFTDKHVHENATPGPKHAAYLRQQPAPRHVVARRIERAAESHLVGRVIHQGDALRDRRLHRVFPDCWSSGPVARRPVDRSL